MKKNAAESTVAGPEAGTPGGQVWRCPPSLGLRLGWWAVMDSQLKSVAGDQFYFNFSITVYFQCYFVLVSGVHHSVVRQSYTLQSDPPNIFNTRLALYIGITVLLTIFPVPCAVIYIPMTIF